MNDTPNPKYDVSLCHNSQDKPAVRNLAELLSKRGIRVWLDEWALIPGRPWQEALEKAIQNVRTASSLAEAGDLKMTQLAHGPAADYYGRAAAFVPVDSELYKADYLNQQGNALWDAGKYADAEASLRGA
ncbi:MAG: toll/interleukin-1 receptor domain-containing protein [Deltaproteobacteria bacterium]|nr:toll/interleukin-1 receptor domain-containing protein [Deltaproteobacteria bacterium]